MLSLAASAVLGACQAPVQVIHLGELPNPRDIGICPSGQSYQREGMSCFDGVQIATGSGYHGERTAMSPTVKSLTDTGLQAEFHTEAILELMYEGDISSHVWGEFRIHGCDNPDGLRVTSLSNQWNAKVTLARDVGSGTEYGPGLPRNGRPTPPFTYGTVSLDGPILSTADGLLLKFEDGSPSCNVTLSVPQSHLSAMSLWIIAASDNEQLRRQEFAQ